MLLRLFAYVAFGILTAFAILYFSWFPVIGEDSLITVYTLLLTIFTGVLGIATIELALIAWRQAKDSRLNSRAYISIEPLGLSPWRGEENRFLGQVGIHNAGVLPARNLCWFLSMEMTIDGDRADFPIPDTRRGNQLVVSGATMTRGTRPLDLTDDAYCFVWGIAEYDDGFGERRFTKFCHRYNTSRKDFRSTLQIPERDARQHEFGNDAN